MAFYQQQQIKLPPFLSETQFCDMFCWAALQPANCSWFCTIIVKMLHISVKTNENKRAACSNSRLLSSLFLGVGGEQIFILKATARCGFFGKRAKVLSQSWDT